MALQTIVVIAGLFYRLESAKVEVCIFQRKKNGDPGAGFWEFPGGKKEVNETDENCLIRELKEELGISIKVEEFVGANDYSFGERLIHLRLYLVRVLQGQSFHYHDHETSVWVDEEKIYQFPISQADIPLIKTAFQCAETKLGLR